MNDSTNNITEQMMKTFADMAKALTPTVNVSKTGYEIRSNVLEMAQIQAWKDYEATVQIVQIGGTKITKTAGDNTTTTTIEMPDVPGSAEILKTAQAFYDFVNNNTRKD
jgi:hypothetical protein